MCATDTLGVLPVDAPGRFVVRPPAGSLFGGLAIGGFFAGLGLWFGSLALDDSTSAPFLPSILSLLLLVSGMLLVAQTITGVARPLLRADQHELRLGKLAPVPWRDLRQVTITRIETLTKHTPDADGRYRYVPQHVIRLELNDGEVRAWTTPNAEPPWTADNLAPGLRRTSPATPSTWTR